MDKNFSLVVAVVAVVGVVLGGLAYFRPAEEPVGASSGTDHYFKESFYGGILKGTNVSTSTQGSQTVTAAQFRNWVNAGVVSVSPNLLAASTITFPASSTISDLVPRAGDSQTFCVRNATTTAGVYLTLAGSTGINLLVSSSSVSALGSTKLLTGKVACITLVRQPATATTYDIDALLEVFQ